MLQMLPMCHTNNNNKNGSQWPPSCIFFVFVGIVATSYAKSFEAFEDFPETFVATTSDLTMELERLMHLKSVSNKYNNKTCNYKTIKNFTSLAGSAGRGAFVANKLLSRRKRFLVFPLGSSFSCAVCLTTGVIGNPNYQYLSMGLNWGLAYDLPNVTWVLDHIHALERKNDDTDMEKAIIKRRHRRDLYHKMETIINSMGYNGRDCVLRALCESRQYFTRNKMGMIGEMLRVIFSLPKKRLFTRELHENSDIAVYDHAYRKARAMDCATQYQCSFSLLELAFGKYAKPPTDYYNNEFGM